VGVRVNQRSCPVKRPMKIINKQWVVAVVLLLLIPVVMVLGGALFSFINPEIAAGHPNYVRNFHLLNLLKITVMWATAAAVLVLWLLVCLKVIRAKKRSASWLVLAALGPFGLAILAMLNEAKLHDATTSDRATAETDQYTRFVRSLNGFVRAGYELCTFVIVWMLAYEAMVLKRTLMVRYEAATTGSSIAQVTDLHNASGGMWAFAEGMEVMFFVVLLYLLRPVVFNIVGRVAATMAPKAS
jgi:hypothetical protein